MKAKALSLKQDSSFAELYTSFELRWHRLRGKDVWWVFYTLKLLLRKMSWGSLLVELKGAGSFRLQKMREKVSFSISLKYHSFKYLCDKRFNRLRFGVLVFQKCMEDLNGPAHQKEEKNSPLERRKWCSKVLKNTVHKTSTINWVSYNLKGNEWLILKKKLNKLTSCTSNWSCQWQT